MTSTRTSTTGNHSLSWVQRGRWPRLALAGAVLVARLTGASLPAHALDGRTLVLSAPKATPTAAAPQVPSSLPYRVLEGFGHFLREIQRGNAPRPREPVQSIPLPPPPMTTGRR